MIALEHFGPPRPSATFVPPAGLLLQQYALVFDPLHHRTVYVASRDYGSFGDVYVFDGSWKLLRASDQNFEVQQALSGVFDTARESVVLWNFAFDHAKRTHVVQGLSVAADGKLTKLETSGEQPVVQRLDGEAPQSWDTCGLFAFDPIREVTVCLTRAGVWELDAQGTWRAGGGPQVADGIPQKFHGNGALGAWDPIARRVVFWMFASKPDYAQVFFRWNGGAGGAGGGVLEPMPTSGLPEKLYTGLFVPAAVIGGHAKYGTLLLAGESGTFHFDTSEWKRLPDAASMPPRMSGARLIHDPERDLVIVGPGHHEGDAAGDQQSVFFVLSGNTWERQGTVSVVSPLKSLDALHVVVDGTWYATSRHSARTFAWGGSGFEEIVSEKSGAAMLATPHQRMVALLDVEGRVVAITSRGAVLELEPSGKRWNEVAPVAKVFGEREGIAAAYEPPAKRLVVWGGTVKDRPSNDVFFFDIATRRWSQPKRPSPLPKDKRGRDAEYVEFTLFWDGGIERIVRLGRKDVAILEGDTLVPIDVKGYEKLAGGRAWEHLPIHDPQSGETLLVRLDTGAIFRFDLAGVELVDTLTLPSELGPKKQHDAPAHVAIAADIVFDSASRTLHAQNQDENVQRYAAPFGPAFDAARKLGPRKTLLGAAKPKAAEREAARLYHEKKRLFWFLEGAKAHSGVIGEKAKAEVVADPRAAMAAHEKAGFVPANKLSVEFLASLGASTASVLRVEKARKTVPSMAIDRLGGVPSGVDEKRWPRDGKTPMGFLFQLATGKLLKKHAGVAVFCTTQGDATEEASNNRALLLTPAEWKAAPIGKAPGDVEVLPIHPLKVSDPCLELDESRIEVLATMDPEMAPAFERFRKKAKVKESAASKLGGNPTWVQEAERRKGFRFLAQLDFDELELDCDWGLAGCLYVFVDEAETKAMAFWQYT